MSKPENVKCPDCDGPMVSRLNKSNQTRFWGCKNFPQCKGTRDVNGLSKEDREANRSYQDGDESDYMPRWDRKN